MISPRQRSLLLAGLQAADLAITQGSSKYGEEHLDDLRVPVALRPLLPWFKGAAAVALIVTSELPRARSAAGLGMVAYYSSAATFHIAAKDSVLNTVPALVCGLLAASLV